MVTATDFNDFVSYLRKRIVLIRIIANSKSLVNAVSVACSALIKDFIDQDPMNLSSVN